MPLLPFLRAQQEQQNQQGQERDTITPAYHTAAGNVPSAAQPLDTQPVQTQDPARDLDVDFGESRTVMPSATIDPTPEQEPATNPAPSTMSGGLMQYMDPNGQTQAQQQQQADRESNIL